MPQLTEELWNKLWTAQNEREAARREELRQAVAKSTPPLTADLVQALIHLNDQYTREIMREHKGFTLAERRTSYLTSLAIMEQCLQDLLAAICAFEADALAEDSTLFDRNGDADLKRFERTIQKELFATANAAASLVDHARRVDKCQPIPNYKAKQIECFGTDGLHDFVIALRVMLHHLHIVEAGWNMTTSFSEGTKTASFTISRATIERVIASSPDRFDRPADAAMKAYVQAAPEQIDLRAVFLDYRARMARFHAWMKNVLESETLIALRDYDFVLREKVKSDSPSAFFHLAVSILRMSVGARSFRAAPPIRTQSVHSRQAALTRLWSPWANGLEFLQERITGSGCSFPVQWKPGQF